VLPLALRYSQKCLGIKSGSQAISCRVNELKGSKEGGTVGNERRVSGIASSTEQHDNSRCCDLKNIQGSCDVK